MFYNLFSFKKKLNLCHIFIGQGFSLAFLSSLYKSWKEGVFLFVDAKRQLCLIIFPFSFFTKQSNFPFSFLT